MKVKDEAIDVSAIYSEQIRTFADTIRRRNIPSIQDTSAAENVRIVEELYLISERS